MLVQKVLKMDKRFYFWVNRRDMAFIQSIVESTDNLARIRTEQNTDTKAKVVFMYDDSQQEQVDKLMHSLREQANIEWEVV